MIAHTVTGRSSISPQRTSAPDVADLTAGVVHVWQFALDDPDGAREMRPLLSEAERGRADRFYTEDLRVRYTAAHGWKRRILAHYLGGAASALQFVEGEFGKPSLGGPLAARGVEFNLSHSGDIGLVAVSTSGPVGVDVERWDAETDHLRLAENFFSPAERDALRRLAGDASAVVAGFFTAWARKEAYIKATGQGITKGLHHFDVTLAPGEPARLLDDRLDRSAPREWNMQAILVGSGYSAAVVGRAPLRRATLLHTRLLSGDSP
jgi:4'-phosphopantetheinyl transferase